MLLSFWFAGFSEQISLCLLNQHTLKTFLFFAQIWLSTKKHFSNKLDFTTQMPFVFNQTQGLQLHLILFHQVLTPYSLLPF